MGELDGLLWVLVIGLFLLAFAVWLDMRRRRRLPAKRQARGSRGVSGLRSGLQLRDSLTHVVVPSWRMPAC